MIFARVFMTCTKIADAFQKCSQTSGISIQK